MKKQIKISPNPKINSKDSLYTKNKVNLEADYFVAGPNTEPERDTCSKTTMKMHNEFSDMFTGLIVEYYANGRDHNKP